MTSRIHNLLCALGAAFLAACSGGSPVGDQSGASPGDECSGACVAQGSALTVAEVRQIISQAVQEAQARQADATIAVVDRVGNVLSVYRMGDASTRTVLVSSTTEAGLPDVTAGLEGIRLPGAAPVNIDDLAAIAKAVTGAYLSSEGNAFSTRTASQIVQEHFNPGERFQPGGPLFGVQFSQLACSDFIQRYDGIGTSPGPHRSPLGLSADPGGLPLYKDGVPVGGVGVMADGVYGLDRSVTDRDENLDELIAVAATFGFGAPIDRRGDQITVEGKTFRFSDVDSADLSSVPENAPDFSTLPAGTGALIAVNGYADDTIRAGTVFGQPESGIAPDTSGAFAGLDAFVFVDIAGSPRFAPRNGTDAGNLAADALSAADVTSILRSALSVANDARAQIRRPLGSSARVTIAVVDSVGEILGMVRTRDAPVFGADVSLQKARTATLFSSAGADAFLSSLPAVRYLLTPDTGLDFALPAVVFGDYVAAAQVFLDDADALTNGAVAFSDRAGGNLSRPFYPDGIDGNPQGPFSKPPGEWSPFSTGLQLDLSYNAILQHILFSVGAGVPDVAPGCAGVSLDPGTLAFAATATSRLAANGLQIFPGSVPIYRNGTLIGGIGISGDGVDQDDMIAFLGLHNAGLDIGNGLGNAPASIRADNLTPQGVRLRYVQCPQAPFLRSDEQNVCDGK